MMVVKYVFGISLVGLLIFLAVKSSVSLVSSLRNWVKNKKSKKSPAEGEKVEVDKTDTDASGKEVDSK